MRGLIVIALVLYAAAMNAQQLPVYSGYVHNPYVLNPAVTGYDNYMDFSLHVKKQWVGLENAPFNQILTVHSSINQSNIGFGGGVYNDQLGTIRNQGFLFSGAYHLPVGESARLGMGISGSFNYYRIDQSKLIVQDQQDLLLTVNPNTGLVPDFSFGWLLHRDDYYFGVSFQNVLETSKPIGSLALSNLRHVNVMGQWFTQVSDAIGLAPAAYISYVQGFPLFADFRIVADYYQIFDFEIGIKSTKDLVFGVGMEVIEDLRINYIYDLVLGGIGGNAGSHELVLSYNFYYNPAYKRSKPRYKWIRK